MRGGRAQISMEYLFIMGIAVLLAVPLIILYYTQTAQLSDEASAAMAQRAATQLAQAADTVYYLGAPSTRTVRVELPENIAAITIAGQSVSLRMHSSHGDYEQVAWSAANLSGSIAAAPGPRVLVLAATEDIVNITEG